VNVHSREVGEIGDEDLRHEDARLVAADLGEKLVDRREHLTRLTGDVLRRIVGDLTGEVRRAVMNGRFAETCTGIGRLLRWPELGSLAPLLLARHAVVVSVHLRAGTVLQEERRFSA
jgi:hypothetical protein